MKQASELLSKKLDDNFTNEELEEILNFIEEIMYMFIIKKKNK